MILEHLTKPNDIKKVKPRYYPMLAAEIRKLILESVNRNGGHLAANLGTVELTMALHLAFDLPKDKLIFDVGHQSYTHKILTGRADKMHTLRQKDGISGFPMMAESDCDSFETGHATTAISAAYGMVRAREILKEDYNVAAIIGDGAMTGGMAYEAINNATQLKSNMLIILNDNTMSIDKNIGGMSKALMDIRMTSPYIDAKSEIKRLLNKVPVLGEPMSRAISGIKASIKQFMIMGMLFENMGITYIGPIDGRNIGLMKKTFLEAKQMKRCVLVHLLTKKGDGYAPAMNTPNKYHSVSAGFMDKKEKAGDREQDNKQSKNITYADILSDTLLNAAKNNKKLVAISAAMTSGTGLGEFSVKHSDRFFDVGIAEEHAVTMAAGMSVSGLHPIVAIYSTFLQRAYDQLVNDAGGMNLPMTILLDRAGFVAGDGRTHQGIYDLSYLATVPNMTVLAPKNAYEFKAMLEYAFNTPKLIAIRVPKGVAYFGLEEFNQEIGLLKSELIFSDGVNKEKSVLLVAVGNMIKEALKIRADLTENGIACSLINPMIINPIDLENILDMANRHYLTVSLEENITEGGFGQRLIAGLIEKGYNKGFLNFSIENKAYNSAGTDELLETAGLNHENVSKEIMKAILKRGSSQ